MIEFLSLILESCLWVIGLIALCALGTVAFFTIMAIEFCLPVMWILEAGEDKFPVNILKYIGAILIWGISIGIFRMAVK